MVYSTATGGHSQAVVSLYTGPTRVRGEPCFYFAFGLCLFWPVSGVGLCAVALFCSAPVRILRVRVSRGGCRAAGGWPGGAALSCGRAPIGCARWLRLSIYNVINVM